jgi:hypothetical protein
MVALDGQIPVDDPFFSDAPGGGMFRPNPALKEDVPRASTASVNLADSVNVFSPGIYSLSTPRNKLAPQIQQDESGCPVIRQNVNVPSMCSSASYFAFIQGLGDHCRKNPGSYAGFDWKKLVDNLKPKSNENDGVGVWGHFNANGPGAALLLAKTGLGKTTAIPVNAGAASKVTAMAQGSLLKIIRKDGVGEKESGHLVVYLGMGQKNGESCVRYFSSNTGKGPNGAKEGMGEGCEPLSKMKYLYFTEVKPSTEGLKKLAEFQGSDSFLGRRLKDQRSLTSFNDTNRELQSASQQGGGAFVELP